jgi:cell volume regulation protein A
MHPAGLVVLLIVLGCAIEDLNLSDDVWISFVIRDGQPVHVRASTVLEVGDEVLLLVNPEDPRDPAPVFTAPPSAAAGQ